MLEMENREKWYQGTLGIIALLVLFFPAGLFLMWRFAKWNKSVKYAVTGLFALIVVISGITTNGEKPKNDNSLSTSQPIATSIPTNAPSPTIPVGAISLDSIATDIAIFKPTKSDDRYIGYTPDGKSNITLIGTDKNITKLMVNFNHIDNNLFSPGEMGDTLVRLSQDAVPEWKDPVSWLKNSLITFSTSSDDAPSNQITIRNKTIEIIYTKVNSGLVFSITVNK